MSATGGSGRPVTILLVEDSVADVELTEEAFAAAGIRTRLHVAPDGESALALLRGDPPHPEPIRPDLILLDLNMPRRDGREVLRDLKASPELCSIPVLMLTTSGAERDVSGAYAAGANAYIRKPVHFEDFVATVRAIEAFWLTVAILPTRSPGGAARPAG